MAERPILFSGRLVRALLAGRKTQTRRIWKPRYHPDARLLRRDTVETMPTREAAEYLQRVCVCPYGAPGDELWCRETWRPNWCSVPGLAQGPGIEYAADGLILGRPQARIYPEHQFASLRVRWRPSIHMPRWASRLQLVVREVRVQRLQEISEEDARAEGIEPLQMDGGSYLPRFEGGWDSINGERGSWASNPWVWAITFEVKL